MQSPEAVLDRLGRSKFRRRFVLRAADRRYLDDRGFDTIMSHARDFIDQRLAPAHPRNDGRQTPLRGHPVFIAQHATATCCRSCLSKWHGIAPGITLTPDEVDRVVSLIEAWLRQQTEAHV